MGRKYGIDLDLAFKDCLAPLRCAAVGPDVDLVKALDAVMFNLSAGNADAYGKTFQILYDENGPDLARSKICWRGSAYPELARRLATNNGKLAMLREMKCKGWAAFAGDTGVGLPVMQSGMDEGWLSRLAEVVAGRAQRYTMTVPG